MKKKKRKKRVRMKDPHVGCDAIADAFLLTGKRKKANFSHVFHLHMCML
jgi:hypothetical protein